MIRFRNVSRGKEINAAIVGLKKIVAIILAQLLNTQTPQYFNRFNGKRRIFEFSSLHNLNEQKLNYLLFTVLKHIFSDFSTENS